MKYFIILSVFTTLACSKEHTYPSNISAVRMGNVTDRRYSDSAQFPGGQYRRYWVLWSHDTICPPNNPLCGYAEWKRVRQSCYDTLFINRYPERLADSVFIPDYPY